MSMSLEVSMSICALFVSLMKSVNGAQFLNTTYLSLLLGFTASGGTGGIDISFFNRYKCIAIVT